MLIIVGLLCVAAAIFVKWYPKYKRRWDLINQVPGPKPKFLVGNALEISNRETFLSTLVMYRETYGPLFKTIVGNYIIYSISDLELLEKIFTSNVLIVKSPTSRFLDRWLGAGLISSSGDKWRRHRKIITPTFHFKILEQFIDVFHTNSQVCVKKLENLTNTNIELFPVMSLLALDIICETAMGTKVDAQLKSDSEYTKSIEFMMKMAMKRIFSVTLQSDFLYYFHPLYKQEQKAVKVLNDYTDAVIKSKKEELRKRKGLNKTTTEDEFGVKKKTAFLDLLIEASENGQQLTDLELREEVSNFLFAGHDTTSHSNSFTLYAIAKQPEIQKKIFEELDSIFGDDRERAPTYAELQEMKYLEMVIKESLRMYPPAPFIAREGIHDIKFGDYTLVEGSILLLGIYFVHYDPKVFPNPEKFDPERFAADKNQKEHLFSYVPFSAGPRNCIGQKFAMLEMKAILSCILRNYQVEPVTNHELKLCVDLLLESLTGIPVKFKKRF